MRSHALALGLALGLAAAGCGIPSEGKVGCPEPCTVTVSGQTVRAESPMDALSGVVVRLGTDTMATSSPPDGAYAFPGLAPSTPLQFTLHFVPTNGDPQGPDTQILAGTTAMDDVTINLPVVQYAWLSAVAVQCNIFTLADVAANLPAYLGTRSTVIGQILNEDNSVASTFDRQDITVILKNPMSQIDYPNPNPADTDANPTKVCFLEFNNSTGVYDGVDTDHSTSGRFIMFRVASDRGTGTGTGRVEVPGFPAGPLSLSAGSVGFVQIRKGDGEPVPPRKLSFSRDVYHFFSDDRSKYMCLTCHTPGGLAVKPESDRIGPGGVVYRADWSGSSQTVYNNLTLSDPSFETNCDQAGMAARVCTKKPDASLLYLNPTGMAQHSGQSNLTATDPFMETALQWIKDGALP